MDLTVTAMRIAGSLLLAGGLFVVFATWRRKGVREGLWRHSQASRWALPGGWVLVGAGLAAWTMSGNADVGLSLGVVAVMMAGCAIVAWQGLRLMGQPAKVQRVRESESDGLALGKGYWGRFAVRIVGSVVVAPVFGFVVGLLPGGWLRGDEADRLMVMAMVSLVAIAAAIVVQLASRRPVRSLLVLVAGAVAGAGLVFLPQILS